MAVLVTGFIGYILLGLAPLDALYMTVITITTVGYSELFERSAEAKIFTMVLLALGVGSFTYAVITGVEFIFEGHLEEFLKRRRTNKELDRLQGHIIVCGYGSVGVHVAEQLQREGSECVVIDTNKEKILAAEAAGFTTVEGDATGERVLQTAHVTRARAVVACAERDADNLLITLTVKQLTPEVNMIARVKMDENHAKLRRAGADRVIAPTTIGGRQIAHALTRPYVLEFLEISDSDFLDLSMEEIPVYQNGELEGRALRDARFNEKYDCNVCAIREKNGKWKQPSANTLFKAGDTIIVIGTQQKVTAMRETIERERD